MQQLKTGEKRISVTNGRNNAKHSEQRGVLLSPSTSRLQAGFQNFVINASQPIHAASHYRKDVASHDRGVLIRPPNESRQDLLRAFD